MLPRQHRLRARRAVLGALRRGVPRTSRALAVSVQQTKQTTGPRFAVIVSAKTAKRAVDRNLVRRRIRASLNDLRGSLPPAWAVVVRVRPPALALSFRALDADLRRLLRNSGRS